MDTLHAIIFFLRECPLLEALYIDLDLYERLAHGFKEDQYLDVNPFEDIDDEIQNISAFVGFLDLAIHPRARLRIKRGDRNNKQIKMKGWNELGVVDTIYEEDQEEEEEEEEESKSSSIVTTSPIFSSRSSSSLLSPPPSLHAKVEEWSMATGCKTDVVIRLDNRCFNLHKEPLVSQSRYLRRRLSESTDITIDLPSNMTADTFSEILIFCYDSINLTPSNLAAVRIAADWLEMDSNSANGNGDGSLMWQTEVYFRQEIACDAENAGHVLRACVRLLPDVTAALLAVRSAEVLAREGADGVWMEELTALPAEGFMVVAESTSTWFVHDHDLLYRMVDCYLEKHRVHLTEEEMIKICHTINCTKLSHHHLLHLVQNPHLPLRFIVQAMLVDQLQTRHAHLHLSSAKQPAASSSPTDLTLGAILQRDAALRQASHVRSTMEATCCRIESLERDLEGLRRKLRWTEEKRAEVESVKSSSFRVVSTGKSYSSTSSSVLVKSEKGFGKKLMDGLKSVFAKTASSTASSKGRGHRRNHSFA